MGAKDTTMNKGSSHLKKGFPVVELLVELTLVKVINVPIRARVETGEQLFLNRFIQHRSCLCFFLSFCLSTLDLLGDPDHLGANFEFEASHSHEHLMQFCQPLLRFVNNELWPILELSIDQLKGLHVILGHFDALPHVLGAVGSLDSLHVQVAHPFLLHYGGVLTVGKRARASAAQPS